MTSGKIKTKPSETRSAVARAKGTRSKIKIEQNNADQ